MSTPRASKFYAEFGKRIREARADAGVSQAAMAKLLRIPRTGYTNLENGNRMICVHEWLEIARALEAPVWRLLPPLKRRPVKTLIEETK